MNIHCKYDELLKRSSLKPHPKNRNKHPEEQIARLAQILKYQGFRAPIVVSKLSNYIVKGHGTCEAAWLNGWDEVPIVYQEFENEEQEYAFIQSDNAIASWAELDLSGINIDLGDLGPDFDIDLLGIKDFFLEPADKFTGDEDAVPEPPKEAISRLGDLYQLGNHRLLCGDSTSKEDVERLMNGDKADMVFTDPPYGVSYEQGKYTGNSPKNKFQPIANDELRGNELCNFLISVWNSAIIKDPCVIYSFAPPLLPGVEVLKSLVESGWHIQSMLIWDKTRLILGRADYQWSHEVCWYGYRGKEHYWCGDRDQTTVWKQKRDTEYSHPTQKPVEIPERAIKNSSISGAIIYEPFCGSGSTLIACEKTNRKCYGMEIDPIYCDVIIKRWEDYTGKKANKIG